MTFRPATVAGTKALTCIYSESGGGKTYSALLLARGLVGPTGRIAMIDTENRRGELYADDPKIGGYDVQQLGEPFSPQRYIDMIDEAEREKYENIDLEEALLTRFPMSGRASAACATWLEIWPKSALHPRTGTPAKNGTA